jgi:arsenite methyltransferase
MGNATHRRPDYGIDAPGLLRAFLAVGVVSLGVTAGAFTFSGAVGWLAWVGCVTAVIAAYTLGMALVMTYGSRVDKVRRRELLLDLMAWRGDETVLDVGCGRGLMLVGAARRVPGGGAVGVDIWQEVDQSENKPEAATENARREGVLDRVTVETADARELPCRDESFDVVVSHWVVHNLPTAADRERAVGEMVRVLKPGGFLVLADIALHADYAKQLAKLGMQQVRHVPPGWFGRFAGVASFGSFNPAAVFAVKPQPSTTQAVS